MYIPKRRLLQIKLDFHTYQTKAEQTALVDSGATDNFIDYRTVARLRLGSQKLVAPRRVRNVDGTENEAGTIQRCVNLYIQQGNKKTRAKFFIMNLGKDQIIMGYP